MSIINKEKILERRINKQTLNKLIFYKKFMEEVKNEHKHGGHHSRHEHACKGLMCKCGPMGHGFVKFLLVVFLAIMLLSIGAALGSRHGYSNYGSYDYGDNRHFERGGCGMHDNWRENGGRKGECQLNTAGQEGGCGQFQMIDNKQMPPMLINETPAIPTASSTFEAPLR